MDDYARRGRGEAGNQAPFVGRQRELTALAALMSRGQWPVVLEVAGEPGIGKTRLLAEFAATAESRGAIVVAGRATEYERTLPFGLFTDALEGVLRQHDSVRFHELIGRDGGLLRMIFPAIGERAAGEPPPACDRWRLYRAVSALLTVLAAEDDFVMILDDVHWADAASADLLRYLLDHCPEGRVSLVVAYRPRQLPPQIGAALQRARPVGAAARLELGPLGQAEVDAILGPGGSRGRRESLYQQSGGNPFYLEAIRARPGALPERPLAEALPAASGLPWAIRVSLRADIDMLGDFPLLVARAAAVTGDPLSPSLLAAVAEVPVDTVLACIDVLVQRDILRPGSKGGFSFRHPVLRQTIYESAGAGWRLAAHERAAAALGAMGSPLSQRAAHIERYAQPGDESVVDLLVAAAEAVQGHAPSAAAHWLEVAVAMVPHEQQGRRVALLGQLAYALGLSGEYARSQDKLTEIIGLLPPGAAGRTAAVRICAVLCRLLGATERARSLLQAELAIVDSADPDAAALMLELAHVSLTEDSTAEGFHQAGAAYQLAGARGERAQLAYAASTLALVAARTGDTGLAHAKIDEVVGVVTVLPDGDLLGHLELFIVLGWASLTVERYREAIQQLGRGLSLARISGQDYLLAPVLTLLTRANIAVGDLAQARACADEAAEAALISGTPGYRMLTLVCQSMVALSAGAGGDAIALGEEAMGEAGGVAGVFARQAACQLSYALITAGRGAEGTDLLLRCAGGRDLPRIEATYRSRVHEALARGYLQLNDPVQARAHARRAVDCAAGLELDGTRGYAQLALARVAAADRPAVAAQHAHAAVACFERSGAVLEAADGRRLVAEILGHRGELRHMAGANAAGRPSDALAWPLARVEPSGQSAGRRSAPTAALRLAELPGRQLEVARLVADARTNRQIARALGVTERTVEAHVSHIMQRLGLASRAAIASLVTRADLWEDPPP